MISAREFNELPITAKFLWMFKSGRFLIDRVGQRYIYNLFYLRGFYVEAVYDKQTLEVFDVLILEKTDQIEFYLKDLSIEELLRQ